MDRRVPELEFPTNLEIGCGKDSPRKGEYIGLDIVDFGQKIVWDAEEGIPLPDNSCKKIFSQHTFEHFDDPIKVFNECWRVLECDGVMEVIVPHHTQARAWGLHHTRLWGEGSFEFLSRADTETYGCRRWGIWELIVNDRPDIYCKMRPIK